MKLKKVNPFIWRGSRPGTQMDYDALFFDHGIRQSLNLERGIFESFTGVTNRDTLMAIRACVIPVRIEMSDFRPPSREQLECASYIISNQRYAIFVHCASGVDRTGMVIAYYRVKIEGWSVDAAVKEMVEMGMHPWYRYFWVKAFRSYFE